MKYAIYSACDHIELTVIFQQYPIAWEVFVDDVFLDGEKLPRSTLSPPSIALSALIDTVSGLSLDYRPQALD